MRRRYAAERRAGAFDRAIGDGQLWLVLLAAWNMLPDATIEDRLQQVTLFRDFVSRRELLGSVEEGRLADLFGTYFAGDVIDAARSRAMHLGRTLRDLEQSLGESHDELLWAQAATGVEHRADDLVWSPTGGWGIAKEDQHGRNVAVYVAKGDDVRKFRAEGWFVNVSQLVAMPGVPEELWAEVVAFVQVLENVDADGVGDVDGR